MSLCTPLLFSNELSDTDKVSTFNQITAAYFPVYHMTEAQHSALLDYNEKAKN